MAKSLLKSPPKSRRGSSLIEVLIGIAVGTVLIVSGVSLLNVSLRVGVQNKYLQSAALLGSELMTKVSAYTDRKWYCVENTPQSGVPGCGIYNLAKGPDAHYRIVVDGGQFKAEPGEEAELIVDGSEYTRYFYVENVFRDVSGDIADVGSEDPSTQKVTVVVEWLPDAGKIENVKYLTRSANVIFQQTDWSGGSGQTAFLSNQVNNKFDISNNIDYSSIPGSIKISGL